MKRYSSSTVVTVHPFTRQMDGDGEVIIGRPELSVFLALPADVLELLDALAEGKTVGDARSSYLERHGELPDMDDLLESLEKEGFVQPSAVEGPLAADPGPTAKAPVRFHFSDIPQSVAQRLVSPPVLTGCALVVALALAAVALDPAIFPGRTAFFFDTQPALLLLLLPMSWCMILVHEMAHLVAARAEGVSCRLGVGHRLWMLVAETDMSGIWAIPRRRRYLPLLAGPLADVASSALLTLVLFAGARGWIALHPAALQLVQAMMLIGLLSVLWQCYFFVRTDFYYVITNLTGCKDLLADTEAYLKNRLARFIARVPETDQSRIPSREMRVIRWYALVWLLGRAVAFWVLFFIQIPILVKHVILIMARLSGENPDGPLQVSSALILVVTFVSLVAGPWLWLRDLRKSRR